MTRFAIFKIINQFFRTIWLSVSSTDFYRDLYFKYQGYGIKYITMIISLTSIIYAILFMNNIITIRNYLETSGGEEMNPVEFMLKDWPDLQYDGKTISREDDVTPVYISSKDGYKIAVIDSTGKLNKSELQKVLIVFVQDKVIIHLSSDDSDSKDGSNNVVFTYDKIFGADPAVINREYIKTFLLERLKKIGALVFLLALPVLIAVRVGIHVLRNLFSIVILYMILWWLRKSPTVASASRIVFFTSAPAECISPALLLISPVLLPVAIFVEYWAIALAIYSIAKSPNNTTKAWN